MVVTSLHLLSGGRADASQVRADTARRLWKDVSASAATNRRASSRCWSPRGAGRRGFAHRRADRRRRRTVARASGGRSVPVGVLGQVTTSILTIHGQNDQLRLLRPDEQRGALDRFAGADAAAALRTIAPSAPGGSSCPTNSHSAGPVHTSWHRRPIAYALRCRNWMRSTRRRGGRRTRRDHQAPDRPGDRARGRGAGTASPPVTAPTTSG